MHDDGDEYDDDGDGLMQTDGEYKKEKKQEIEWTTINADYNL